MFYANFILSKKGPLARVWLAAHWEKKLSKAHVFETNVESSVESIMSPKVKMALRTSGHLLLGVVRIYSRKAKYLLADCTEAFVKIKMAFRPGVVDLPEDGREASMSAVTLPEVFNDFDLPLPDLNDIDIQVQFNLNQCRAEEITMKEDYIIMHTFEDEGFGDTPFGATDDKEILRGGSASLDDSSFMRSKDQSNILLDESNVKDGSTITDKQKIGIQQDDPLNNDVFGGLLGNDGFGDEFGEGVLPPLEDLPPLAAYDASLDPLKEAEGREGAVELMETDELREQEEKTAEEEGRTAGEEKKATEETEDSHELTLREVGIGNETTIVQNDEEAFVLEPIEVVNKEKRSRRKRKLIVDDEKILSSRAISSQLANTDDIVQPATLAPPTKLRMKLKDSCTADKLFNNPAIENITSHLHKVIVQNLTAKIVDAPEVEEFDEKMELEEIESPKDNENEEEVIEKIRSPSSPRKRRSKRAYDSSASPVKEALENPAEVTNDVNFEQFGHMEDPYIPEEESRVDFEENAEEIPESQLNDEQASGEKYEEFQARRWTKRTQQLMHTLRRELKRRESIALDVLSKQESRKQVAVKFYSCLLLKRDNEVELQQKDAFGKIYVSKGPCFDSV